MSETFQLSPDPLDPHAFYDAWGNRYVFHSHREYEVARQLHVIDWLVNDALLRFL